MAATVAAAYFYSSLQDRPLTDPQSQVAISERIQDVGTPAWGSTDDWATTQQREPPCPKN